MDASPSSTSSVPTESFLRELLDTGAPPHVSVFMPIQRPWNKAKENPLRLKSLLEEAHATLQRRDVSESEAEQILQPAFDLTDDEGFWNGEGGDGLSVFVSRDHFSTHQLPFSVFRQQFVDHRFHVRPILRHLEPDGPYFLLALSQGGVKLFRGSRYTLQEVSLENVPTTLEEALKYDEHIRSVTFHTGTRPGAEGDSRRRSAMYHGQEDAGDKAYVKEGILRFFRTLDNEVRRLLKQEATPPPLVLAGVDALRGLYRKANHYPHLTETDVEGHFVDWTDEEFDREQLQERAWSIVEPLYARDRTDAAKRYEQLSTTDRGTGSLHAVIPAAYDHRIETLFVAEAPRAWGRFLPRTHEVEIHTTPAPSDVELLNAAVAWTLAGDGTVYVVDPEDVPSRTAAAAILRY